MEHVRVPESSLYKDGRFAQVFKYQDFFYPSYLLEKWFPLVFLVFPASVCRWIPLSSYYPNLIFRGQSRSQKSCRSLLGWKDLC